MVNLFVCVEVLRPCQPNGLQSDVHPTEPPRPAQVWLIRCSLANSNQYALFHGKIRKISEFFAENGTLSEAMQNSTVYGPRTAKRCLQSYADCEGPDQTVHSHSLIRAFTVR